MPNPPTPTTLAFKLPIDLHNWLQTNHASQNELWVKIYKKGSGIPSVSWEQVVIESLCWGWIDGVKKSLNDLAYLQRITPRRPKSVWSKRNTEHVERLITEGRMKEPGLIHVTAAKADGRWEKDYRVSEMQVPADFLAALEHQPEAKQFFDTLSKSNQNTIAYGLDSAKKPETRQKRFDNFMNKLINKET